MARYKPTLHPQLPLNEYLLEIARQVYEENDLPEKARGKTAITLRRRFRGTSKSDLLGEFDRETDAWLGDGVEVRHLMNMHSFQVVKPVIRANQSAMVQARVQCEINPTSHNPALMGVASIGRGIYRYLNNHPDYWSNNLENQIAQQSQTDYGYWIRSYHDPDAESPVNISVDEYSDEAIEQPGEYACAHCGAGGPLFSEQMGNADEDFITLPCFECGETAEILAVPEESSAPFQRGKTEYPAGNNVMEVVSSFQIRIDEKRTKNGNIRRARWLEHHFLMDEDELQQQVPYYELGSPHEWSYPLKWEHALETGTDLYLKLGNSSLTTQGVPKHEVRRIYLRPEKYRGYVAPADFDLDRGDGRVALDREGKPMLSIRGGQRLADIRPNGFWFVVCDGQLLPWSEPCDLRDEWSYGGFLNDAASVWYQPASELNELQRTANNLWTIDVQHRESGSIATTAYDRNYFEADDFEKQLMPTKDGVHIEGGDNIHNHFADIRPPQMTGAMEGIAFIRNMIPDISGVQPATVGASAPGEPYAAQRLQVQQSLGLLTPSQQSKAECKSITIAQQIKICQRTKPIEWYQYIGTMYGEEWKERDIEAFINADLNLALTIWYKEGSETPTSLIERELKYRQFILDMGQVAQFTANPNLVQPEMISKYAQIAGMDYDVENIEADQRLADSRFQKFKEWIEFNRDSDMPEELMVELALAGRDFAVMPMERHATHIEFYMDHARPLLAADFPNFALISCCLEMVKRHEAGQVKQDQVISARKVEGSAPELAAQAAAMQAAQQAEENKLRLQMELRDRDNQAKMKRDAMMLEAKAQEGDENRALEAEMHADDAALKAAEIEAKKSEGGEEETDEAAIDVVMKSPKYPDLPPTAQTAILQRLGLPASGTKEVHEAAIAKQQIAATKARAQQANRNGSKSAPR